MSWKDNLVLVLDTETTGLDHSQHRVIEIGFAVIASRAVVRSGSWLLKPSKDFTELDPEITRITGIQASDLINAVSFQDIHAELTAMMDTAFAVAAYNEPFDRPFITAEYTRIWQQIPDKPWLDPLVWVKEKDKFKKGKKLVDAATRRNIKADGAHRAEADAIMAAKVLLHELDPLPDSLQSTLDLQNLWRNRQDAEFKQWKAKQASVKST